MSKRTVNVEELLKIETRRRMKDGQLRPLAERLSQAQMDKREVKIWARRTVADKLVARHNQFALVLHSFFGKSFWGRLRWLVTGK